MAGLLPNSGMNSATVARQQLLFAFPQYGAAPDDDVPIGRQRYDAGQSEDSRAASRTGLSVTVAYTVCKTLEQVSPLNPQDVNLDGIPWIQARKAADAI